MSDTKKVTLTSVSSPKAKKNKTKKKRTIRLRLTLPESNEKAYPEFNYGDLLTLQLHQHLGKQCLGDVINGPPREQGDPYASDEEDALKALARKFENKYGGDNNDNKKRKRKQENDFKQLGEGYDESDPFIDNSDAIDDVLPTNIETKYGGFYINSGQLNFEEVQVSEDDDSQSLTIQINRKRKKEISSDDDNSEEENNAESGVCENGIIKNKTRKLDEGEMLRRRKKMIDKFNAKKVKTKEETAKNDVMSKAADEHDATKCSNGTSIAASIEAVVSKAREGATLKKQTKEGGVIEEKEEKERREGKPESEAAANQENPEEENVKMAKINKGRNSTSENTSSATSVSSSSSSASDSSPSDSESEDDDANSKDSETEPKTKKEEENDDDSMASNDTENGLMNSSLMEKDCPLPTGLPPDLVAVIDKIIEIGKNSKASSQKFFSDAVNKMLLSIEIKLCKCGKNKRNLVYSHLSQHLPCGTQTLIKRGKNLLTDKLNERLKLPIQRLKDVLEKAMDPLLQNYKQECQEITEKKYEMLSTEQPDVSVEVNKKKLKLPKKVFVFTPEIRSLLCDIVKIRCQGFHMIKKRVETPEEHIKSFIESDLKTLWPKGWIATKKLYEESKSAHSFITSKNSSDKKTTVLASGTVNSSGKSSSSKDTDNSINIKTEETKPKAPSTDKGNSVSGSLENGSKLVTGSLDAGSLVSNKKVDDVQAKDKGPTVLEKEAIDKSSASAIVSSYKTSVGNVEERKTVKSIPQHIHKPIPSLPNASKDMISSISSPISESQKSFHGFETVKPPEPPPKAKQQLNFDSLKKQTLSNVDNSDTLLPLREGKPPKPSLTATAKPKITMSDSDISKCNTSNSSAYEEKKLFPNLYITQNEPISTIINSAKAVKNTSPENEKKPRLSSNDLIKKDPRPPTKAAQSKQNVRIIDLSSDDESQHDQNVTSSSQRKISDQCNSVPHKTSSDSNNALSDKQVIPLPDSNNKLAQEMDHVMNELLQISKKNQTENDVGGQSSAQTLNKLHSGVGSNSIRSPAPTKTYDNPISNSHSIHMQKINPKVAHSNSKQVPFQPMRKSPEFTQSIAQSGFPHGPRPSNQSSSQNFPYKIQNMYQSDSGMLKNSTMNSVTSSSDISSGRYSSQHLSSTSLLHPVNNSNITSAKPINHPASSAQNLIQKALQPPHSSTNFSSTHSRHNINTSGGGNKIIQSGNLGTYKSPPSAQRSNNHSSLSSQGAHNKSWAPTQSSNIKTNISSQVSVHKDNLHSQLDISKPKPIHQANSRNLPTGNSVSQSKPFIAGHNEAHHLPNPRSSGNHSRFPSPSSNISNPLLSKSEFHTSGISDDHRNLGHKELGLSAHSAKPRTQMSQNNATYGGSMNHNAVSSTANIKSSNDSMHVLSHRPSKPSHNIEGLLYNSSSSLHKSPSPMNLSHSQNTPHQHKPHQFSSVSKGHHHPSKSSLPHPMPKTQWDDDIISAMANSSDSQKANLQSSKITPVSSKLKAIDGSLIMAADSNMETLANLRLMEGLSVKNVPIRPQPTVGRQPAVDGQKVSPNSQRANSSTPEHKLKPRYDSYQPMTENEQQKEYWKKMNQSPYGAGVSPGPKFVPHSSANSNSSIKRSNQH